MANGFFRKNIQVLPNITKCYKMAYIMANIMANGFYNSLLAYCYKIKGIRKEFVKNITKILKNKK